MKCEKLNTCPFYQHKMPMEVGMGAIYVKRYCESDKFSCARYQVSTKVGADKVPINLYPNMHDRAEEIIKEKS